MEGVGGHHHHHRGGGVGAGGRGGGIIDHHHNNHHHPSSPASTSSSSAVNSPPVPSSSSGGGGEGGEKGGGVGGGTGGTGPGPGPVVSYVPRFYEVRYYQSLWDECRRSHARHHHHAHGDAVAKDDDDTAVLPGEAVSSFLSEHCLTSYHRSSPQQHRHSSSAASVSSISSDVTPTVLDLVCRIATYDPSDPSGGGAANATRWTKERFFVALRLVQLHQNRRRITVDPTRGTDLARLDDYDDDHGKMMMMRPVELDGISGITVPYPLMYHNSDPDRLLEDGTTTGVMNDHHGAEVGDDVDDDENDPYVASPEEWDSYLDSYHRYHHREDGSGVTDEVDGGAASPLLSSILDPPYCHLLDELYDEATTTTDVSLLERWIECMPVRRPRALRRRPSSSEKIHPRAHPSSATNTSSSRSSASSSHSYRRRRGGSGTGRGDDDAVVVVSDGPNDDDDGRRHDDDDDRRRRSGRATAEDGHHRVSSSSRSSHSSHEDPDEDEDHNRYRREDDAGGVGSGGRNEGLGEGDYRRRRGSAVSFAQPCEQEESSPSDTDRDFDDDDDSSDLGGYQGHGDGRRGGGDHGRRGSAGMMDRDDSDSSGWDDDDSDLDGEDSRCRRRSGTRSRMKSEASFDLDAVISNEEARLEEEERDRRMMMSSGNGGDHGHDYRRGVHHDEEERNGDGYRRPRITRRRSWRRASIDADISSDDDASSTGPGPEDRPGGDDDDRSGSAAEYDDGGLRTRSSSSSPRGSSSSSFDGGANVETTTETTEGEGHDGGERGDAEGRGGHRIAPPGATTSKATAAEEAAANTVLSEAGYCVLVHLLHCRVARGLPVPEPPPPPPPTGEGVVGWHLPPSLRGLLRDTIRGDRGRCRPDDDDWENEEELLELEAWFGRGGHPPRVAAAGGERGGWGRKIMTNVLDGRRSREDAPPRGGGGGQLHHHPHHHGGGSSSDPASPPPPPTSSKSASSEQNNVLVDVLRTELVHTQRRVNELTGEMSSLRTSLREAESSLGEATDELRRQIEANVKIYECLMDTQKRMNENLKQQALQQRRCTAISELSTDIPVGPIGTEVKFDSFALRSGNGTSLGPSIPGDGDGDSGNARCSDNDMSPGDSFASITACDDVLMESMEAAEHAVENLAEGHHADHPYDATTSAERPSSAGPRDGHGDDHPPQDRREQLGNSSRPSSSSLLGSVGNLLKGKCQTELYAPKAWSRSSGSETKKKEKKGWFSDRLLAGQQQVADHRTQFGRWHSSAGVGSSNTYQDHTNLDTEWAPRGESSLATIRDDSARNLGSSAVGDKSYQTAADIAQDMANRTPLGDYC